MKRSRRQFCVSAIRALGVVSGARYALGFGEAAVAPEIGIDQLRRSASAWEGARARAYRADVVVTLLGVPVFSRQNVGAAAALLRESSGSAHRTVSISFAGGSDPKRTHGLNYTGATEEVAVESGSALVEAASFGYVTATSQEESFDQARKRVEDGSGFGHGSFVVVDELHSPTGIRIRRALVPAAPAPNADFRELTGTVRSQFAASSPAERSLPDSAVSNTFLYSVLSAARSPERRYRAIYLHAGKRYQLDCDKASDPHTGAALAAKNVAGNAAAVVRLTGQIHDFETKHNSTFKLWMEEGTDLPLRIEFSPRSYLRISLEVDPANAKEAM
jgi:hypothetical protein